MSKHLGLFFLILSCFVLLLFAERISTTDVKRCINYSPIFFNSDPSVPPFGDVAIISEENHYKVLLPYLKQHGVNCIRLYFSDWKRYHADFFRTITELDMICLVTFWLDTRLTPNLSDPKTKQRLHDDAVFLFKTISNEPSVSLIFFGNELDLVYPKQIPQVFSAFQDFIELQREVIPDPSKRKNLSLPLSDSGENLNYVSDYSWVESDFNSFNIYRGSTLLGFVDAYYFSKPNKPLIISETGSSSYFQFPNHIPKPFIVYNESEPSIMIGERYQAMTTQRLIMEYIAATVMNPGALHLLCLFEATDEFWKSSNDLNPYCQSRKDHLMSVQNTCGYYNNMYKDHMIHEAFLGLMRQNYTAPDFSLVPKPSFKVMSYYFRSMDNMNGWSCQYSPSGWNVDLLNTGIVPDVTFDTPYDSLRLFENEFQTISNGLVYTCKFNGNIEKLDPVPLFMDLYNTGEKLMPYIVFTGLDDFWNILMLLLFVSFVTSAIVAHITSRLGLSCKKCCKCCTCSGGFLISEIEGDFNSKVGSSILERVKEQNFLFLAYNLTEYLKRTNDNSFVAPQLLANSERSEEWTCFHCNLNKI